VTEAIEWLRSKRDETAGGLDSKQTADKQRRPQRRR